MVGICVEGVELDQAGADTHDHPLTQGIESVTSAFLAAVASRDSVPNRSLLISQIAVMEGDLGLTALSYRAAPDFVLGMTAAMRYGQRKIRLNDVLIVDCTDEKKPRQISPYTVQGGGNVKWRWNRCHYLLKLIYTPSKWGVSRELKRLDVVREMNDMTPEQALTAQEGLASLPGAPKDMAAICMNFEPMSKSAVASATSTSNGMTENTSHVPEIGNEGGITSVDALVAREQVPMVDAKEDADFDNMLAQQVEQVEREMKLSGIPPEPAPAPVPAPEDTMHDTMHDDNANKSKLKNKKRKPAEDGKTKKRLKKKHKAVE